MSIALFLGLLLACNDSGEVAPLETPGPTVTTPTGTAPTTPTTTPTTATGEGGPPEGLSIDGVTLSQSVEIILVEDGDPVDAEVPLVVDRPAWMRVFVDVDEDSWESRDILGKLTVSTGRDEVVLEDVSTIRDDSDPFTKRTTINFDIDADLIQEDTTFDLELLETDPARGEGKKRQTTWSSDDSLMLVGETDVVEVFIIPIQYDADGSGRLPDTSPAQIQAIADKFYAMYPVKDVVITVGDPSPWPYRIDANGAGWDTLLDAVSDARTSANVDDNVYFYALFTPEDRFEEFCRWGCVLGLSYLAYSPRDTWARASMGVGWTGDVTVDTLVHEVGHAHGREHAPCGVYDWDRNYPHSNGNIGVWGYDLITKEQYQPLGTKDMMSYCDPIWLSDYTYNALFARIRDLGPAGAAPLGEATWPTFRVDDAGVAVARSKDVRVRGFPGGEAVDVELLDGAGDVLGVQRGYVVPYAHVAGGRVLVDAGPEVKGVRLVDPSVVQRDVVLYHP